MRGRVLLSTAYFPPAEYFSLVARSEDVVIEKHENYIKQTYRNRCMILGPNGPLQLTVPVLRGSFHKTPLRELRIDNSRRWQELHLRGITSSYAAAPFYEYYYDIIESVISEKHEFLLDLNDNAMRKICDAAGLEVRISFTDKFTGERMVEEDYRYKITPKRAVSVPGYKALPYTQVFSERYGFTERMSIIDILLNNGPGTRALLQGSLENRQ